MAVTAKFSVQYHIVTSWAAEQSQVQVILMPDYTDGKNAEWAASTPSGKIELTIDPSKTDAANLFTPGKSLTVTFDEIVD